MAERIESAVVQQPSPISPLVIVDGQGKHYPLHYENGVHSFTDQMYDEVGKRFSFGDLSAHNWNPEVAQRIRKYSPYVLGLDTLSPSVFGNEQQPSWTWLPGSPKEMTGRDSIYVVSGDFLHFQSVDKRDKMYEELQKVGWDKVMDYGIKSGLEDLAIIATAIGSLAGSLKTKTSRRGFISKGLLGISSLATAVTEGRLAPVAQSYSSDSSLEQILQDITEITRPRLANSSWLDGRTALVVAKTVESMDILDLPDRAAASIVMGFPHGYKANTLLLNKNARQEMVLEYAKNLVEDILPIAKRLGMQSQNEDDDEYEQFVKDVIASILVTSEIYEVKEPEFIYESDGIPRFSFQSNRINRSISSEVKEALSKFGNAEKYFTPAPFFEPIEEPEINKPTTIASKE